MQEQQIPNQNTAADEMAVSSVDNASGAVILGEAKTDEGQHIFDQIPADDAGNKTDDSPAKPAKTPNNIGVHHPKGSGKNKKPKKNKMAARMAEMVRKKNLMNLSNTKDAMSEINDMMTNNTIWDDLVEPRGITHAMLVVQHEILAFAQVQDIFRFIEDFDTYKTTFAAAMSDLRELINAFTAITSAHGDRVGSTTSSDDWQAAMKIADGYQDVIAKIETLLVPNTQYLIEKAGIARDLYLKETPESEVSQAVIDQVKFLDKYVPVTPEMKAAAMAAAKAAAEQAALLDKNVVSDVVVKDVIAESTVDDKSSAGTEDVM